MLGSGAVLFVGDGHNLLNAATNVATFFRNESCGKCVPCRVGTEKAVQILEASDTLNEREEVLLRELNHTLRQTSICGLGQIALGPLISVLDNFPRSTNANASGSPIKEDK
jgi:NADH:ubiquinone oxidoreductase subunit F (NADH-binding)